MQHDLATWFLDGEDWLVRRVLEYARRQGYTRYTSTLEEAWRLSIQELSAVLTDALAADDDLIELGPDDSFESDPISLYAISEADRHRQRGFELKMFFGLFKCYRQAYLDRVDEAGLEVQATRLAQQQVTRIFDRLEIAFCSAWASVGVDARVHDLQERNRELANEKNRFLTVTESLASPVILLDPRRRITYLNQAAAPMLDLPDRPGAFYYRQGSPGPAAPPWLEALLDQAEERGAEWRGEHVHVHRGSPRTYEVLVRPMLDVSDRLQDTVVILHDITPLRRAETELAIRASDLERLSHTDPLTGLLNRRGLHAAAGAALEQARRSARPLSVLYGDVDNLKAINDRFGHAVGDAVLVGLASALRRSVRAADLIARIGGDELVIVLPDSGALDQALVERRLDGHLGRALDEIDDDLSVSVSTGWAVFDPVRHANLADLLADADNAMYQAKQRRQRRRLSGRRKIKGANRARS